MHDTGCLGLVHWDDPEGWNGESEVTQPCPTLCDPMDCSLPGSSIHGILQARVLEWIAIAFSLCVKRQNDRILKEELPRSAGAQYATGEDGWMAPPTRWTPRRTGDCKSEHQHSRNQRTKMDWNGCNLISGSSAFSKARLNIWKFTVHVLLKPGLENFVNLP